MPCPRCSAPTPDAAVECPSCGIVIGKWRARESTPSATVKATPPPPPEILGIPHPGWRAAGIGLVLAWLLTLFPFISFILSPLSTLVHEIGHTVVLWLFGYSAIPAFDFGGGGGVTMSEQNRSSLIVAGWVLGLVGLGWHYRHSARVLFGLAAAALAYLIMFDRTGETLAVTVGGHAGEVAFGALFLYRALTGWGCKLEAERPLYAFIAFMILFAGIKLGWSLRGPTLERIWYLEGKGGIDNDLVTAAQILGSTLSRMAGGLIAASILAIPTAFLAAANRKAIGVVSEAEEEV